MTHRETTLATRAIHGGGPTPRVNQPVVPPVHLSSTFEAKDIDEQVALEERKADTFYTRYGNPTLSLAERVLAGLEGAESAAVFGSGMAAAKAPKMASTSSLLRRFGRLLGIRVALILAL